MKKLIIILVIVCVVIASMLLQDKKAIAPELSKKQTVKSTNSFDKTKLSTIEASSIWVIVNKLHPVSPASYEPADLVVPKIPLESASGSENMHLRSEAAKDLENMVAAAKKDGINLMLVSGYRSYQTQTSVYNGYVQQSGAVAADKFSARPGTSEHQTGLAADLGTQSKKCELDVCFSTTTEGKWLAENSYMYGYILRYNDGKYTVVGYNFEPWHFRYIGLVLASEMHKQNIQTLEEFFNQVPAKQPY